jgi:hypothetical protein
MAPRYSLLAVLLLALALLATPGPAHAQARSGAEDQGEAGRISCPRLGNMSRRCGLFVGECEKTGRDAVVCKGGQAFCTVCIRDYRDCVSTILSKDECSTCADSYSSCMEGLYNALKAKPKR